MVLIYHNLVNPQLISIWIIAYILLLKQCSMNVPILFFFFWNLFWHLFNFYVPDVSKKGSGPEYFLNVSHNFTEV